MNLDLMLLIDRQFLDTPLYGVRQMTWHLQNEGHAVNQKRIRRLRRLMRLMPIFQKPDTSRPAKGHKTYHYLLGGRISNTLEADFCVEALNEAVHKFGPPEIMNMEHGRAIGSSGHATSSQPVHVLRLDRPAKTDRHPDLDRRQRPLPRQPSGVPSDRWQECPRHVTSLAAPEI